MTKKKVIKTATIDVVTPPTPAPSTRFSIPEFFKKLRASPWVLLVVVAAIAAAFLKIWPDGTGGETDMSGWVITWFGSIFKAISGAVVARWFCRHVMRIDLSAIPDWENRTRAALAYAIVMGAFILGVTKGI